MKEDFVNEDEIVEFEVGGRKFGLRYLMGPELDEIDSAVQSYRENDEGRIVVNINQPERNNRFLKKAVMNAPYDGGDINVNNGEGKPLGWGSLNESQRLMILNKLKNHIRNPLIIKIIKMNSANPDLLKK